MMMTNLFSSFDPCASSFLFTNWTSTFLLFLLLPSVYFYQSNRLVFIFKFFTNSLIKEFNSLLNLKMMHGVMIMFISLFMLIVINNLMGLFPYVFTSTSHMVMTLTLALPLWLSLMLFGWINLTKNMFAHLVPLSTPSLLMPFMVLIESISLIIRPLTLAIRLSANMIAGHLLMTLLGNQTSNASFLILSFLLLTQIMLLTLELAVASIQAYVFTILSTLYSSEIH